MNSPICIINCIWRWWVKLFVPGDWDFYLEETDALFYFDEGDRLHTLPIGDGKVTGKFEVIKKRRGRLYFKVLPGEGTFSSCIKND